MIARRREIAVVRILPANGSPHGRGERIWSNDVDQAPRERSEDGTTEERSEDGTTEERSRDAPRLRGTWREAARSSEE